MTLRIKILIIFILSNFVAAQSIVNSVHNLSVSGPGSVIATSEDEICIFCHTPHNSSPRKPLWNRTDPAQNYTLYSSSTAQAIPGQPSGSSILCLSCHDGTIALGNVLSLSSPINFSGGITTMPLGNSNLSQDLSDDHPLSFIYNSTLAGQDGQLVDPLTLTGPVQLENEQLQCISCHDAHSDINGNFLVLTNQNSVLCVTCHDKTYWLSTSHRNSTATWNSTLPDPWFHTSFGTVAENGCENCHDPHSAAGHERTMNFYEEENNCVNCHNGNVANTDIQIDILKTYAHNVYGYDHVHDPDENNLADLMHVECEDCHNPHAARDVSATAPNANGFLEGVKGIDTNGNDIEPIQNEFELCYRCHADSPNKPGSPTTRQIAQDNVRLEFDVLNPSFHPIEGAGTNSNVPSLISPLNESSIIYCTDCHASNGAGSASGPHGSIYPHILKYNYETADYTQESYLAYELCYQCHDRNTIINSPGSFGEDVHTKHIVEEETPCNACHDPHGINNGQVTTSDHTHLINFDTNIVFGVAGIIDFVDNGNFSGSCYLRCHFRGHNPRSY